jgi:outer membrane protein insertion porin family
VQVNPSTGACISNCVNIPVPYLQLVTPGGDFSVNANAEYRITIAGPVAIAPFLDAGLDPILRNSQLQVNPTQFNTLLSTRFGCPIPPNADNGYTCQGGTRLPPGTFSPNLSPVPGTNWVVRMSTGIELQTMLPVVNAPFRIYYAYNARRLDSSAAPPIQITRGMFPCPVAGVNGCTNGDKGAGDYTYNLTKSTLGSNYTLREPRKTFRFSVATTF